MRSIENETRLTMNTRRNFVNYATMTLSDGTVLNLTPSDFRISGQSFTDDWGDGEAFQIGTAIGKTATLLLDNTDGREEEIGSSTVRYPHGKFSQYDFYMAYFVLYVCLPDAYTYGSSIMDQMIPIGLFTVTTPVANSSTIEITGVDNMFMFDKSFDDCTLNFENSPTLLTILNRCCQDCGVAIGYTTFDNETMTVSEKPENVTYRQVVSWIAQIAGCNAVIDENGALRLKWYDTSAFASWLDGGTFNTNTTPYSDGDVADGGTFSPWNTGYIADGGGFADPLPFHNLKNIKSTQVSTDEIHFTGVVVKHDETEVHYPDSTGWDTYALEITENPFVAGNESEIAQDTYNKLSGLIIRPFTCSSLQDPTIEAGDCALVYDTKGNTFPTLITNVKFTTGGYTEVSCKAESPIKQNARYINPAAQAVVQAEKKMDDYNKQVAHFNSLANDALGYYQTEQVDPDTGSTILYVHDSPTLANSQNIWKITSTGIFISEDGGQSYNSGLDTSTATMLMNLVYAKGIVADWIQSGSLLLTGKEGGVTFEAYNYFYWAYEAVLPTTQTSVVLSEFENAYSPIIEVLEINETITATLEIQDNGGTIVDSETITLAAGENTFELEVPARYYTNYQYTVLIRFSAFTTILRLTIKGYHYAFDIRPNNFVLNGSKFCDAYCCDLLVDNAEAVGKMTANLGRFKEISADTIKNNNGTYVTLQNAFATTLWVHELSGTSGHLAINIRNANLSGDTEIQGSSSSVQFTPDSGQFFAVQYGSYSHYVQWSNYSDKRLKENIRPADEEYIRNFFDTVKPVKFNFIEDKNHDHIGLIAQDLQSVFEGLDFNNNQIVFEDPFGKLAIDYPGLVGHLIAGVKDLYSQIDTLKAEIEELKK